MKNILQLLVAFIFTILSINLYADDMSPEKLIKERKGIFKQNYSYAKKMSSEIAKGNKEAVSDLATKCPKTMKL